MPVYLTVMVGARPEQARPVFASSDRLVVNAALRALLAQLGVKELAGLGATARECGKERTRRGRGG